MEKKESFMEHDTFQAASSGDCTGLIPALPSTEQELEFYEELYNFLPPGGKNAMQKDHQKHEQRVHAKSAHEQRSHREHPQKETTKVH